MPLRPLLTLSLLSLALLLTSSCASISSPVAPKEEVSKTQGVLLAAVTSDRGRMVKDVWYYYRKAGTTDEHRLAAFGLTLVTQPNDFPGLRTKAGRLLAIPLEPGEYELCNWTLYIAGVSGGYGYITPKTPPPPHRFTIAPGRITYLGNLSLETVLGKNLFGMRLPAGANPVFSNTETTDLPLLRTKYPNLAGWPLDAAIPGAAIWAQRE